MDYVLEVDLEYPQHLHDAYIPIYYRPIILSNAWETIRQMREEATLYDKKHYVIHYRNL